MITELFSPRLAQGADYDLVVAGSGIGAVNGSTGNTDFSVSSGDHAPVVQAAINVLRPSGGVVALKAQTGSAASPVMFTGSAGVTIYPGIALIGQGPLASFANTFPRAGDIYCNSATAPAAITMEVDATYGLQSFPFIWNLSMTGVLGNANVGILVTDQTGGALDLLDAYIDHVLIFNFGSHGINCPSATKLWVDSVYLEDCAGSGIKDSGGSLNIKSSYIFGNALWGIDMTSGNTLQSVGNFIWNNGQAASALAGGGVIIWSTNGAVQLTADNFSNNGNNSNPQILIKDSSAAAAGNLFNCNTFAESRAAGSKCTYYIQSAYLAATRAIIENNWFYGTPLTALMTATPRVGNRHIVRANIGMNEVFGQYATPFTAAATPFIAPWGTAAAPTASTVYVVDGPDVYLVASGGTAVSITIQDQNGNTLQSGLTTYAGHLKQGQAINFGAFTGAPAVMLVSPMS